MSIVPNKKNGQPFHDHAEQLPSISSLYTNGNKGIAAGLNNLQKLSDGTPLGGHSRAEDDFADLDDEDDFLD